jgi:hypothetical protein
MPNGSGRLAFFKKRIGKVVFRTHNSCDCWACAKNYDGGIIVRNIAHAEHLVTVEESGKSKYFASEKERDEFVRTQQKTPTQAGA